MQNTIINQQFTFSATPSRDILERVVINSLPSQLSKRVYRMAIEHFFNYLLSKGNPSLDKLFLQTYIADMQDEGIGEGSINLRLAALRKLSREAEELKIWPDSVALAFTSVKNIPRRGHRTGNWLSLEQAQQLINAPDTTTPLGLRNRAMLAVLIGCGLRRHELVKLTLSQLQQREGRWVIVDLVGKRRKSRTVTVPAWVKVCIDAYLAATHVQNGHLFHAMTKGGHVSKDQLSTETVWAVVDTYSKQCGFPVSPHDLRRTYAKLAFKNGAKIDQIQLNLGHESLATTQVYLGTELDLQHGPGDYLAINIQ